MRIALLAPLVSPIAPPFLGGAQALLFDLATGLAARGHAVTLYAADGSDVPGVRIVPLGIDAATLRPAIFTASKHDAAVDTDAGDESGDEEDAFATDEAVFQPSYAFLRVYRAIAAHADEHDLLHAHAYDQPAFAFGSLQPLPIVHTLHLAAVDGPIREALHLLAPPGASSPTRLVTVSHACAATYAPYCRIDAVIYNGVDVARIPFGAQPDSNGYLLFAGRIAPEKGVADAISIAEQSGHPLLLAGGIYDQAYFDSIVAPRLAYGSSAARYLGAVSRERLWELMAGARAVLAPAQWEEPFSLVACEAQAAGAPVIAYARGGLREVVADGETGWLITPGDVAAAVDAVARIHALDRADCRERVIRTFSLNSMLDAYEAFYTSMLQGRM
ncbi:MAG TPA: glycosyltransferase [Ktedonobacterales bacterium]|nr:glycosyltransferase [Ktedonobacterales bacterium]